MKKIILTLIIVALTTFAFGQETTPDTTKKDFKNVIGIDATGLIQQFFNLNSTSYSRYPYIISYRRIFKNNAFRIGVNGDFHNTDTETNDTIGNKSASNDFKIGLGFEHYSYISEKWNFYFGADAIAEYYYHEYKYDYTATSSTRNITTTYEYGVSPLLGLVFRINSRLCIATETSYRIKYITSDSHRTYIPESENDSKTKGTGFKTQFIPPTTINLRIQF